MEQIDPDLARANALSLYKRIREAHRENRESAAELRDLMAAKRDQEESS